MPRPSPTTRIAGVPAYSTSLDAIAREVGYLNPFAFSNIFKKMTGLRPSSYRAHKAAGRGT